MTFDGKEWFYVWSGENRLILASNATHVVTYAYDHRGRMVWKTVSRRDAEAQSWETEKAIAYVWDGYNIIAEHITTNGTTDITYNVWGLDLSGTLQGAGGVGGLLAMHKGGVAFLSAYDANGNITEYISADGSIAAHHEYSAFGETTKPTGALTGSLTFWWSTKPWCNILNKIEYQLRIYDSNAGRWVNRDPISEKGFNFIHRTRNDFDLDLYVFVRNNPISIADWLGLAWRDWQECKDGKVWKQKGNGVIPAADGCSVPAGLGIKDKNNPTGKCSFKSACDQHDNDYSNCTIQKMSADESFMQNMINACNNCNLGGLDLQNCYTAAQNYAGAVMLGGGNAYKNRQQKNCECACK
jgi:RHS repeat-associated protein